MKLSKLFAFLLLITVVVSSCSTKKSNKMLITYDVPRSMPEVFVINKRDSLESTYSHKIKAGDRIAVKLYSTILNNPIIEVSIVSIKVNVFGEVGKQGKFLIDRDNISLIDLISEAGGLTNHAKKKAIRIIRGDPSNPQIIIVDLRKVGILRYSELMIQDNDIVIVDAMRVYEISEPTTAIGTMLQPLLLVINSIAIVATLTR